VERRPTKNSSLSRRDLLTRAAAAGVTMTALPEWFLRDAWAREQDAKAGRPRKIGPNDTVQVGVIGPGGSRGGYRQGLGDAKRVAGKPGAKVVVVCDVDAVHREEAKQAFGGDAAGVAAYNDFRELLARPDIDAVVIGTPDHWHAVMAIAAMRAGKDVYCEKPLTLTIEEGRRMVKVARETGRVLQTGSQQRSDARFRLACELVRNGRIGKVQRVEAHIPGAPTGGPFPTQPVPADLDWDMWLGPAPMIEYLKERTHGSFRWWYEYSGGIVTDWGAHHLDIAQWGLGKDGTGPVKVEAVGTPPPADPTGHSYNVFPAFDVTFTYADGTPLLLTNKGQNGVRFEGEDGKWIFVNREKIEGSDPALLTDPLPADAIKLYVSGSHEGNWLDCIRSREKPVCDVEVGHRSASVCHLANIALRLNQGPLEWDPKKEEFKKNKDANAMRSRPMRGPWKL
jgi:predicted dehydrogenase